VQLLIREPEQAEETGRTIDEMFTNSVRPTRTTSQKAQMESNMRGIVDMDFVSKAIVGAALLMLLVLTGNVMAQSVRERIPEFAVLKTLGFSDSGVFRLVLAEALLPCLVGAGLGLALAYFGAPLAYAVLPAGFNAPVPEIGRVAIYALPTAFALAVISGLPAAYRMKRLPIADALAGR
jgi:putative ABC transport system permease protein